MLRWFNTQTVRALASSLADEFAPLAVQTGAATGTKPSKGSERIQQFARRVQRDAAALRLNFYQRAKLANAFRWRLLLEHGADIDATEELTRILVLEMTLGRADPRTAQQPSDRGSPQAGARQIQQQLLRANQLYAQGEFLKAVAAYRELLELQPRNADAFNNLGSALWQLGRYQQAEEAYRRALAVQPKHCGALNNLGAALKSRGEIGGAETTLQRAIRFRPDSVEAKTNLGNTQIALGKLREARLSLAQALNFEPEQAEALLAMGRIARIEGRFDEAEALFRRALAAQPKMPAAWAALAGVRRMTVADGDWLKGARAICASGIAPLEEADLQFAMGKYLDDVGQYPQAFRHFERGNELLKAVASRYDRVDRDRLVEDLRQVYSHATVARLREGGSNSDKPVFVVGMMRSGTSLVEQIIASHPHASGAGELPFWTDATRRHGAAVRREVLELATRRKLADEYLGVLARHSGDATRVVDKATMNSDVLGLIHSVFPKARIIYLQRDPIDTCLSCFFQQFSAGLNFTMDLDDLAHYCRSHLALMQHWRSVLPPGVMLEVPYAELVADQEGWTRRIVDFVGLDWDPRCLDFHETQRPVVTASTWQVRQRLFKTSLERWRNYERFIGPLLALRDIKT